MNSISQLMDQLAASPQWRSQLQFRQLLAAWSAVVGTAVAQHSRPTAIHRGVLQVATSSAAWAQNLTFERHKILQKLSPQLPPDLAIRDIRFATAQWRSRPRTADGSPGEANWQDHPSALPVLASPTMAAPVSAEDAFQQWAHRLRSRLSDQSTCPQCHCPCPTQELQRWSVCALCVTQQWQGKP